MDITVVAVLFTITAFSIGSGVDSTVLLVPCLQVLCFGYVSESKQACDKLRVIFCDLTLPNIII